MTERSASPGVRRVGVEENAEVPVLVISPHLDDAALSVGQLLAGHPGSTVVTVFAGEPAPGLVSDFDASCGFRDSRQAMAHRRREDLAALNVLRAGPVHLPFLGRGHGDPDSDDDIVAALGAEIDRAGVDVVIGPVGLVHPDHERVSRLWRTAVDQRPGVAAVAYEELPYRRMAPRRAQRAAVGLRAGGAVPYAPGGGDLGVKAQALLHYVSQLKWVFPPECLTPEVMWRLA